MQPISDPSVKCPYPYFLYILTSTIYDIHLVRPYLSYYIALSATLFAGFYYYWICHFSNGRSILEDKVDYRNP